MPFAPSLAAAALLCWKWQPPCLREVQAHGLASFLEKDQDGPFHPGFDRHDFERDTLFPANSYILKGEHMHGLY